VLVGLGVGNRPNALLIVGGFREERVASRHGGRVAGQWRPAGRHGSSLRGGNRGDLDDVQCCSSGPSFVNEGWLAGDDAGRCGSFGDGRRAQRCVPACVGSPWAIGSSASRPHRLAAGAAAGGQVGAIRDAAPWRLLIDD